MSGGCRWTRSHTPHSAGAVKLWLPSYSQSQTGLPAVREPAPRAIVAPVAVLTVAATPTCAHSTIAVCTKGYYASSDLSYYAFTEKGTQLGEANVTSSARPAGSNHFSSRRAARLTGIASG